MPSVLKRIRGRFGIAARRMAVRTHVAWYWRWLGMIVALAAFVVAGALLYDAGRRDAGFDRRDTEQNLSLLRKKVAHLTVDARRLRAIADASESRVKIEQSAQAQLAVQVKALEGQNTRLKEDLAFFENLSPTADRLSIHRFTVDPDALPGEYRYRLLVIQGRRLINGFEGSLQLVASLREGGRDATMTFPDKASAQDPAYRLRFKYFQRVEGTFRIPEKAKLLAVQVRVLQHGSTQARATQSFNAPK